MQAVKKEAIERAKQMDLLTYLQTYEPYELVRIGPRVYCTRTHDSLKISNGKWFWWSQGFGGRSALDYLIKVKGMSFIDAVVTLEGQAAIKAPVLSNENSKTIEFILPIKNCSTHRVEKYLEGRGIHKNIIDYCIKSGILYEDKKYHNAVFVGFDKKGIPKYGMIQGTNSKRFVGEVPGSDKHFSFSIHAETQSDTIRLFESAIDLLSYATLDIIQGEDWCRDNLLSLAGIYKTKNSEQNITLPLALEQYLKDNPNIKTIVLHLDNDTPGRNAAKALIKALSEKYEVINCPPAKYKDYNDELCALLGINNKCKGEKVR